MDCPKHKVNGVDYGTGFISCPVCGLKLAKGSLVKRIDLSRPKEPGK